MSVLLFYGAHHGIPDLLEDSEVSDYVQKALRDKREIDNIVDPIVQILPNTRKGRREMNEWIKAIGPGSYRVVVLHGVNYHMVRLGKFKIIPYSKSDLD